MFYSLATFLMVLICSDMYIWNTGSAAQGYDNLASAITAQCSVNDLTIHLLSSLLPTFDHTNFHLKNKTCKGNQLNDTCIIFKTKFDECGTTTQTYNGSIIFHNILQGHLKNNRSDSKNITTKFTVECKILNNASTTNVTKPLSRSETVIEPNVQSSMNSSVAPSMETKVRSSAKPSRQSSIKTAIHSLVKPEVKWSVQLSMNGSGTLPVKMSLEHSVKPDSSMEPKEQKSVQDEPVAQVLTQKRQDSSKTKGNLLNMSNLKQRFEGKRKSFFLPYWPRNFLLISKISPIVIFKALNAESAVRVGDKVTFQAHLSETNRILQFLAVEMCYASLDENEGSMKTITFIENGCETRPALVNYIFQHKSLSQRFNFKVSRSSFDKRKSLYVKCKFLLCSTNDPMSLCVTGCRGSNKKIKASKNDTVLSHAGPFAITGQQQYGPGMLVLCVVAGTAVCIFLVAVSLIMFLCMHRYDNHKRRNTLLDKEDGLSDSDKSFHDDCSVVFKETTKTLQPPDGTVGCAILNMDWTIV